MLLSTVLSVVIVRQRKPEVGDMHYSYGVTLIVIYITHQYHKQHCTFQAFELFKTVCMHNHDDKHPTWPGFDLNNATEFQSHRGIEDVNIAVRGPTLDIRICVYRRQILTSKINESVQYLDMVVDPLHRYSSNSNKAERAN